MSEINKINIFSQTKTKRNFVGVLWRDESGYHFKYDKEYTRQKNAVTLGPEFELWKDRFVSKSLFPSLADRIPSKQNPAYADYCQQWGIDPEESDPFVLLVTIGRRGPSTFIFEKALMQNYTGESVKQYRVSLGLTQYEFESLLGLSRSTLIRLEQGKSTNETLLTYIQTIENTPAAFLYLLKMRGQFLHDQTVERLLKGRVDNQF